jgi:hypothetical protein
MIDPAFDALTRELGNGFVPPAPRLEFLYRLCADCAAPLVVGDSGHGLLKVIPITGGRFEGPRLRGDVLSLGADWNTAFPLDESSKTVDTRYLLKTDDGALISLSTRGWVRQSAEVAAERAARKPVDPSRYYFKQHLFFETAAEDYAWLNGLVAFGIVISKKTPGVIYDAYGVM